MTLSSDHIPQIFAILENHNISPGPKWGLKLIIAPATIQSNTVFIFVVAIRCNCHLVHPSRFKFEVLLNSKMY